MLGGIALLRSVGGSIADAAGWSGAGRRRSMMAGAATCASLGVCVVAATFFEKTWAPPPTLNLVVPRGFRPSWTILLEDRSHQRPLVWQGHDLPFMGRSTTIVVPPGGVVRVISLEHLAGEGNIRATWSDGVTMVGATGGRAPNGSGATGFVAYQREHGGGYDPRDDLPIEDEAELARYLHLAESGGGNPHQ